MELKTKLAVKIAELKVLKKRVKEVTDEIAHIEHQIELMSINQLEIKFDDEEY